MNWSDERYARLYNRDTVTWLGWRWETRALLCFLLRKVDRSGVLEVGRMAHHEALALVLQMPADVVEAALADLVVAGTVETPPGAVVLPKFTEAQEARQSDKLRQSESRTRRTATLRNFEDACHTPSHAVTDSHTVSQHVTPAVPCRAVPSVPSQQKALAVEKPTAPEVKAPKGKPPTDPRHFPARQALEQVWREERGTELAWSGRHAGALTKLLALAGADAPHTEPARRYRRALRHQGWPSVTTPWELVPHWDRFASQPLTKNAAEPAAFEETADVAF